MCSVNTCDRPVKAKGLCAAHYKRFKIKGVIGGEIGKQGPKPSPWIFKD